MVTEHNGYGSFLTGSRNSTTSAHAH